jgi:PAS domain S-box-containing protein
MNEPNDPPSRVDGDRRSDADAWLSADSSDVFLDTAELYSPPAARSRRGLASISRPFVVIFVITLVVAAASLDLLSSIRAYVGGEGIYSKAQKDAVYLLERYVRSRDESDYQRFQTALARPVGDREARLALLSTPVDLERARRGFLAGGNDAGDIRGMIWLFRAFHRIPPMTRAIEIWTLADGHTAHVIDIGERLHKFIGSGAATGDVSTAYLQELDQVNGEIAPLEDEFSRILSGVARQARTALIAFILGSGAMLGYLAMRTLRSRLRERQRYETGLRASEGRYRSVFQSSMDAVLILNGAGRVLAGNPAALRVFGASVGELVDGAVTLPEPPDGPGVAQDTNDHRREVELRRTNGSAFPAEVSYASFLDHNGERRWSVVVRDLAERRSLEAEQQRALDEVATTRIAAVAAERRHDARFRALIESSANMIGVVTPVGAFTYQSPGWASAMGWSGAKAMGSVLDACHPEDRERLRQSLEALGGRTTRVDGRMRLKHGDGSWRQLSWSATSATAVPGVEGIIVAASDITAQLALEEQLQQSRKLEAIGQLAGGIAHDFNNILASVLGYTSLLERELAAGSKQQAWAQKISAAGIRARDLVQQILAFSRRGSVDKAPHDLTVLVREATELLKASLPATAELKVELTAAPLVVQSNAAQISQVIVNLCINAQDALDAQPGLISVRVDMVPAGAPEVRNLGTRSGDEHRVGFGRIDANRACARIRVTDSGVGMEPETLRQIFMPFFTTKPRGRGTGLGLAVIHGIVSDSSGGMAVTSRRGAGTTCTVYLPLSVAEPSQFSETATGVFRRAGSRLGSESILVVDDEPMIAELLQEGLTRLGYKVTASNDPVEAVALLEREPARFDVLITDQVMPKMTGLAVVARARALCPGLPTILCTGFSVDATEDAARSAGVNAFLYKPVSIERIALTIRGICDAAGADRMPLN